MKKKVFIVVPVFNEEVGVRRFLDEEVAPVVAGFKQYEIGVILVDDGSGDRTVEEIEGAKMYRKGKVKILRFTRNFGKEAAMSAGIIEARGMGAEAVVMMDGDGQHPAEAIPEMLLKWEEGAEVVKAVRTREKEGRGHRLGSRLYYILARRLGTGEVKEGEMDFGVISRVVMDEFVGFREHKRMVRGLIDYLGFPKAYVRVRVNERLGGKPSYSTRKLMVLAADSIVAGSRQPLMYLGTIGVGITMFSFILGMFILIQEYILGDPLGLEWSGAVAMSVFVAFLVGLVLLGQAVTGIYISQIHIEAKNRPLYVIDRKRSKL